MKRQADQNRLKALQLLLKYIKKGKPILTAQDIHKDVPTIHNFAGRYRSSVEHLGYGLFKGQTNNGEFDFDAGGAMNRDGGISWTTLRADNRVLRDLHYDMRKVRSALEELIAQEESGMTASSGDDIAEALLDVAEALTGERTAARGPIVLKKIRGEMMEREARYVIQFRGKDWGELYFNMRGYVAERGIPVPKSDGSGQPVGLDIGEKGLSAFKREISRANREWASVTASSRTAAVKDLKTLKSIIPEVRKKQKEYEELQRQQQQERNRVWYEATKDLEEGTHELLESLKDALVKFFESAGIGVRKSDTSQTLAEVFLGSRDGVKRQQSKVSVQISLTFDGREEATYMLRNEDLDDIQGSLSDTNTVKKLIAEVKKAHKRGFFDVEEL